MAEKTSHPVCHSGKIHNYLTILHFDIQTIHTICMPDVPLAETTIRNQLCKIRSNRSTFFPIFAQNNSLCQETKRNCKG